MSKRITAVAASALALALGCEQPSDPMDDQVGVEEETVTQEETGFNQEPEDDRIAQAEQRRQQQMRQQQMQQHQQHQMGQAGQGQGQGSPGQVVTEQSENNLDRTLSQLNRQLRENEFDVVATVRYDERMRQRAMREQGGQQARGQQGQQARGQQGGEIGDVRMILFRRPEAEARGIESEGPEMLLKAPRALLVYERGENVIVSYQTPEDMPAVGMEEPTTELLQRIVRESTQPRQQRTAQREEQQGQGQEQQAQGMEQQAQREEQQAQREEQQAQRERQAMTQQQREQAEVPN